MRRGKLDDAFLEREDPGVQIRTEGLKSRGDGEPKGTVTCSNREILLQRKLVYVHLEKQKANPPLSSWHSE